MKWSLLLAGVAGLVGATAIVVTIRRLEADLPSVQQLRAGYQPPQVTRILASDGTLLGNVFVERRTVVNVDAIPSHAKLAFLAAEDASFYEHEGLDYLGMLRALVRNLKAGHTVQGGSTITQQVVKNLLLDSTRSYSRKARETILARRLEQHLSKDEIFGLYLNQIYLGHGRYGIEEAASFYFGKHASELDLAEAATLAGIVAAPERFSPRRAKDKALDRRRFVLHQMLSKGFITKPLYDQATAQPLRVAPAAEVESDLAPEIVSLSRAVLARTAGAKALQGGFTILTSLRTPLQAAARAAVRANLDEYAKRHKLAPPYTLEARRLWGKPFEGRPRRFGIYVGRVVSLDDSARTFDVQVGAVTGRVFLGHEERYNPQRLPPSRFTKVGAVLRVALLDDPADAEMPSLRLELGPQSALVSIDVRTREVVALVGSYEAIAGGLDRATNAKRQPGSAFKPFVYGYALASRRVTPATAFTVVDKAGNPEAPVLLRTALARSLNPVAEQVLELAGSEQVVQWAHATGIESQLGATPSLALGAYEVSPLELANAYTTFAAGGISAPPIIVKSIATADGSAVPLPPRPPPRRVMDEDVAYLVSSLLTSVVEQGTGRRALALKRPAAGKTGTTNKAKDAWFAGYTTDLVTAVWVGYDDALPLGSGESGAVTALPAWVNYMRAAHEGRPPTRFPRPPSVIPERIDPNTGFLALPGQEDAVEEEFLPGTKPTDFAPQSPDVPPDDAPLPLDATGETPRDPGSAARSAPQPPAGPGAAAGANRAPDGQSTSHSPPPF